MKMELGMTSEVNVTRKLQHILAGLSPRTDQVAQLSATSRGNKRARMLEAIGQTVLARVLVFTSEHEGTAKATLVLNVNSSRVTAVEHAEPESLGNVPDLTSESRTETAQQLGALMTEFSRVDGDVHLQSFPPETAPGAEDVGITLSELLAVVTVEELPEDVVEATQVAEVSEPEDVAVPIDAAQPARAGYLARFYDSVDSFSAAKAEITADGAIARQSEPELIAADLAELLTRDLQEWENDSGDVIAMPQLIVMRPEKPKDPALALYRTESGTVVSVHETRKLGSVVSALKELRQSDEQ